MGVSTTASQHRDSAKEHITDAIKDLMVVLDSDTYGHSEYSKEYIAEVEEVALTLIQLKRKL